MVLATGTITAVRDRIAWGEFTQGQHAGRTLDMPAVYDDGNETFVITAGDGVFRMSNMRPGSYVLEARKGSMTGGARVDIVVGVPAKVEIRLA